MRRFATQIVLFLLLSACAGRLTAQNQLIQDSLAQRLSLLQTLYKAGNNEQAQVEALSFIAFLQRHKLPTPSTSVAVLTDIFQTNKDTASCQRFLETAERDARLETGLEKKADLLTAISFACERIGQPKRALVNYRQLAIVRDSLSARSTAARTFYLQQKLDSLESVHALDGYGSTEVIKFKKQELLALAGICLLLFLLLLYGIGRTGSRWRKRLQQRELEMEIERANDRQVFEKMLAETPMPPAKQTPEPLSFQPDNVGSPDKIALLIEPNRQVVIYLKSLLSDRFRVETAFSANEGLQRAADLLPDLIVCDAVLNGKTGIDVARQIKLSEKTNHIPVILLSDRYGNEGKLDALRAGAEAWFTRPVLDDEFGASVQRLLDARKDNHDRFTRVLHFWFTDHREVPDNRFLNQTMELIEQNLADADFMADDLAKKMQLPRHHFVKKLGVLTGKEPVQLIREMRLEKAKILLEKRAGTPQAIADLVGFSNPGTFALAFKEYFGENTLLLNNPPPRIS